MNANSECEIGKRLNMGGWCGILLVVAQTIRPLTTVIIGHFFCLYHLINMASCVYGSSAQPRLHSGSYSAGQTHEAFFVLTAKTIRRLCYAYN